MDLCVESVYQFGALKGSKGASEETFLVEQRNHRTQALLISRCERIQEGRRGQFGDRGCDCLRESALKVRECVLNVVARHGALQAPYRFELILHALELQSAYVVVRV